MVSLIDGTLKLHLPLMQQRSVVLDTKFVRPAYVWGRSGELRQVFTNLIGNAIDALPQGGHIRVSVSCGSNGEGVSVTIADDGPGIPTELREKIFEPSSRPSVPREPA